MSEYLESYYSKDRKNLSVNEIFGYPEDTESVDEEGSLLDRILQFENIDEAFDVIQKRSAAAGIDGVEFDEEFDRTFQENKEEIIEMVREGLYEPMPLRAEPLFFSRRKIMVGVPTVQDLVLQQAMVQVLKPVFESDYSEFNYTDRTEMGFFNLLAQVKDYTRFNKYIMNIHLFNSYNFIPREKIFKIIQEKIPDKEIISLIEKFVNTGMVRNGKFEPQEQGIPQGGPLFSLLDNIYLSQIDHKLEEKNFQFIRFEQDIIIFSNNQMVTESKRPEIVNYIQNDLGLRVRKNRRIISNMVSILANFIDLKLT